MPGRRFRDLSAETPPKVAETVHASGLILLAVVVGLAAGCLLGAQPSVNAQLGRSVSHPFQATLISFASGTAIVFVLSLLGGNFPPVFTTPPRELPWWVWCGGAIGVVLVTASLILVPKVGSLLWFAAVMTGQMVAAILLDHFGLLGNPQAKASPLRLLGAGLMVAGVLLIVHSKLREQRSNIDANSATTVTNPDHAED